MNTLLDLQIQVIQPMIDYYRDMAEYHQTSGNSYQADQYRDLMTRTVALNNALRTTTNMTLDELLQLVDRGLSTDDKTGFDHDLLVDVIVEHHKHLTECVNLISTKLDSLKSFLDEVDKICRKSGSHKEDLQ